jgi:hypothetical protein
VHRDAAHVVAVELDLAGMHASADLDPEVGDAGLEVRRRHVPAGQIHSKPVVQEVGDVGSVFSLRVAGVRVLHGRIFALALAPGKMA